ncbi:MAG: hypothetical protein KA275_03525 [Chitinophagaceae bacterium]|nr:hypothetical protein [Chitinophagaceae bacterium]
MKINKENYEMFLMQYADNELDCNEVKELLSFMDKQPELKDEFLTFKNIKINVDENEKFDNKHLLYKKTTALNYVKYALPFAASLLLVIFLWQRNIDKNSVVNRNKEVVKNEPSKNIIEPKIIEKIKEIDPVLKKELVEENETKLVEKKFFPKKNNVEINTKTIPVIEKIAKINNDKKLENKIVTSQQIIEVENIKKEIIKPIEKEKVEEKIVFNELKDVKKETAPILTKNEKTSVNKNIIEIELNENLSNKVEKISSIFHKVKTKINEYKNTEIELSINNNYKIKTNN